MTLREVLEAIWQRPGCQKPLHYARIGKANDRDGLPHLVQGRPALCEPPRPAVVWPDPPMRPLPSGLPRQRSKRGKL